MQGAAQRNIVDEGALSAQQLRIDIPFNPRAECPCRHETLPSLAAEKLGSAPNRSDDVDVAGAAAKVSRQHVANAVFRKVERFALAEIG